jgi:hypothetical protein
MSPIVTVETRVKIRIPKRGLYLIQANAKTNKKIREPITNAIKNITNPNTEPRREPIKGIQDNREMSGEKKR